MYVAFECTTKNQYSSFCKAGTSGAGQQCLGFGSGSASTPLAYVHTLTCFEPPKVIDSPISQSSHRQLGFKGFPSSLPDSELLPRSPGGPSERPNVAEHVRALGGLFAFTSFRVLEFRVLSLPLSMMHCHCYFHCHYY